MKKSDKIDLFMKKGILISPDLIDEVDASMMEQIEQRDDLIVLDKEKTEGFKLTVLIPIKEQ